MIWYRWNDLGDLYLSIYVLPQAKRFQVIGLQGEHLKIRIPWKPIDGEANKGLVKVVGDLLECKQSCISIVQGQRSRYKILRLVGVSRTLVAPILDELTQKFHVGMS